VSWPGRRPAPGFTARVPDFEAFFEALPAPCIVFAADDPRYTIVAVNEAYLAATRSVRYGARGLLGRPLFRTFPDPLYDPMATETANLRISLHRVMLSRSADRMAVQRFETRDAEGRVEERYWSPVNAPVLDDDGEVAFIVHQVEDVTGRLDAHSIAPWYGARTHGAASFMDYTFAQAPVAIAVLRGPEHVFASCNRAYGALAGHRPLVGLSVREAFPEVDVETIVSLLDEVWATRAPYVVNEFPINPDGPGPEIYYNFVYQPLTDTEGTVTGIAVIANDVTELVQERDAARRARAEADMARHAAEEASRATSRMLSTLSHEMRTPLNAIAGYTQLLGAGVRGPVTPAQLEDLQRIRQSQLHLTGVVNSVMRHAKLEHVMGTSDIDDVPVADVCAAVESLVMPQMREKGLTFSFTSNAPDLFARANEVKLRQILLNLLSNAVKFTAEGGHVSVTCGAGETAGTVTVQVSDSGIGIAEAHLEKVFEPFVQVSGTVSPDEGVGLGLSISRDLARAMGGDVAVRSTLGAGSTFVVTLPAAR
jgi:signal transduction histidine kinase